MPHSLYEYSQLCCIVETMVFGLSLTFIGNDKVKNSSWMRRAKWAFAVALLLVGVCALVQYCINTKELYPKYHTALNINLLYAATFLFAIAFLPVTNKVHNNYSKLYPTLVVFLLCGALVWISTMVEASVATIIRVCSLSLYLFELLRITIISIVSIKMFYKHNKSQESEIEDCDAYFVLLARCVVALSVYALIYAFLVLWSTKTLAIYNFATLPLWAYLFVTLVNMVINHQPCDSDSIPQLIDTKQYTLTESQQNNLKAKVNRWISTRGYCKHGITLIQVAEQLGTNRTYLSRYINETTGGNFSSWLTQLRIEESKRVLISSPALSIDKVAMQVGFASKSYFMSAFKSLVGTTPGQWREQNL